jgi:pyrroloquinoline quinone biosynthesis protein B
MRIKVLGSAAGGGFPQWNCNCPNCRGLREGKIRAHARTQSSIAVSADARNWVLLNASPDLLAQLRTFPALQPARAIRDTAVRAIILTDAQIDHTTGLLLLREGAPLTVYCTDAVCNELTTVNPVFAILENYCGVEWHRIPTGETDTFSVAGAEGLSFKAVALKGKPPPYSFRRDDPTDGDNIGLRIENRSSGKILFYAPSLAEIDAAVERRLGEADCVIVDGTFWTDDELIRLGISRKRARDMGHLPQSGAGGMMERLRSLNGARKILVHINNTNPILDDNSPERQALQECAIEVAHDGMEVEL